MRAFDIIVLLFGVLHCSYVINADQVVEYQQVQIGKLQLTLDEALENQLLTQDKYNQFKQLHITRVIPTQQGLGVSSEDAFKWQLISERVFKFIGSNALLLLGDIVYDKVLSLDEALKQKLVSKQAVEVLKVTTIQQLYLFNNALKVKAKEAYDNKLILKGILEMLEKNGQEFIDFDHVVGHDLYTLEWAKTSGDIGVQRYEELKSNGVRIVRLGPEGVGISMFDALRMGLVTQAQVDKWIEANLMSYVFMGTDTNTSSMTINDALSTGKISVTDFKKLQARGVVSIIVTDSFVGITSEDAVKFKFITSELVKDPKDVWPLSNIIDMKVITTQEAFETKLLPRYWFELFVKHGIKEIIQRPQGVTITEKQAFAIGHIKTIHDERALVTLIFDYKPVEPRTSITLEEALQQKIINQVEYSYYKNLGLLHIIKTEKGLAYTVKEGISVGLIQPSKDLDENELILLPKVPQSRSLDDVFVMGLISEFQYKLFKDLNIKELFLLDNKKPAITIDYARKINLISEKEYENYKKSNIRILVITTILRNVVVVITDFGNVPTYVQNILFKYGITQLSILGKNNFALSIEECLKLKLITEIEYNKYKTQDITVLPLTILDTKPYKLEFALEMQWITKEQFEYFKKLDVKFVTRSGLPRKVIILTVDEALKQGFITKEKYDLIVSFGTKEMEIDVFDVRKTVITFDDAIKNGYITKTEVDLYFSGLNSVNVYEVLSGGPKCIVTLETARDYGVITVTEYQTLIKQNVHYIIVIGLTIYDNQSTIEPSVDVSTVKPTDNTVSPDDALQRKIITEIEYEFYKKHNIRFTIIDNQLTLSVEDAWRLKFISEKQYGRYKAENVVIIYLDSFSLDAAFEMQKITRQKYITYSVAGVKRVVVRDGKYYLDLDTCLDLHLITKDDYNKYISQKVSYMEDSILDSVKFSIEDALKYQVITQEVFDFYKELGIIMVTASKVPYKKTAVTLEEAYKTHLIDEKTYNEWRAQNIVEVTTDKPFTIEITKSETLEIKTAADNGILLDVNDVQRLLKGQTHILVFYTPLKFKHYLTPMEALYLNIIDLNTYQTYVDQKVKYILITNLPSGSYRVVEDAFKNKIITREQFERFQKTNLLPIELLPKITKIKPEFITVFGKLKITEIIFSGNGELLIPLDVTRDIHLITEDELKKYQHDNIRGLSIELLKERKISIEVAYKLHWITMDEYKLCKENNVLEITFFDIIFKRFPKTAAQKLVDDLKQKGVISQDVYDVYLKTRQLPIAVLRDINKITKDQFKILEKLKIVKILYVGKGEVLLVLDECRKLRLLNDDEFNRLEKEGVQGLPLSIFVDRKISIEVAFELKWITADELNWCKVKKVFEITYYDIVFDKLPKESNAQKFVDELLKKKVITSDIYDYYVKTQQLPVKVLFEVKKITNDEFKILQVLKIRNVVFSSDSQVLLPLSKCLKLRLITDDKFNELKRDNIIGLRLTEVLMECKISIDFAFELKLISEDQLKWCKAKNVFKVTFFDIIFDKLPKEEKLPGQLYLEGLLKEKIITQEIFDKWLKTFELPVAILRKVKKISDNDFTVLQKLDIPVLIFTKEGKILLPLDVCLKWRFITKDEMTKYKKDKVFGLKLTIWKEKKIPIQFAYDMKLITEDQFDVCKQEAIWEITIMDVILNKLPKLDAMIFVKGLLKDKIITSADFEIYMKEFTLPLEKLHKGKKVSNDEFVILKKLGVTKLGLTGKVELLIPLDLCRKWRLVTEDKYNQLVKENKWGFRLSILKTTTITIDDAYGLKLISWDRLTLCKKNGMDKVTYYDIFLNKLPMTAAQKVVDQLHKDKKIVDNVFDDFMITSLIPIDLLLISNNKFQDELNFLKTKFKLDKVLFVGSGDVLIPLNVCLKFRLITDAELKTHQANHVLGLTVDLLHTKKISIDTLLELGFITQDQFNLCKGQNVLTLTYWDVYKNNFPKPPPKKPMKPDEAVDNGVITRPEYERIRSTKMMPISIARRLNIITDDMYHILKKIKLLTLDYNWASNKLFIPIDDCLRLHLIDSASYNSFKGKISVFSITLLEKRFFNLGQAVRYHMITEEQRKKLVAEGKHNINWIQAARLK